MTMPSAHAQTIPQLTRKITGAGITLDQAGLTPCAGGADNLVFAARTGEGLDLVVKTPRRPGTARYGTAAWAARTLASHQIPAPLVIWHDTTACAETRCSGIPLTGTADRLDTSGTTPLHAALRAARQAGALLRAAHSIAVVGYGKLTPDGTGLYQSLLDSIRAESARTVVPGPHERVATAASGILPGILQRLDDPGPRLLLGDCAARHIYLDPPTGTISGFIDLESARGGHPLADIAGFSVREHPQLTQALLAGYFPAGPDHGDLWALTIHRARIAASLLLFHAGRGEHDPADRLADALTADIAAITSGNPTALPAHLQ
jgi:aminoglycoside phosphotransferase (APT) family kinase protein